MLTYRPLQAQTQPEFQEAPEPHAGPGQVVVVDLTALGRLKILVDRYPLSAAKQAYGDFEHGRLFGRAVLMPAASETPAVRGGAKDSSRIAAVTGS